ncbi:von Willebrand factor, type A [Parasponia andersonii]|uniref:Protein transport protein SEC23 n=1 Tax=Parasponia andersonii TaxID=3476 RepID=A0A2P5AM21_PARAD|nr:von Willebrand factor, type A [Parasponia andersonii]
MILHKTQNFRPRPSPPCRFFPTPPSNAALVAPSSTLHCQDLDLPLLLQLQSHPSSLFLHLRRHLPAELFPYYTTIKYKDKLSNVEPPSPPVFIFVIDTCIIKEEMVYLNSALSRTVDLLRNRSIFVEIIMDDDSPVPLAAWTNSLEMAVANYLAMVEKIPLWLPCCGQIAGCRCDSKEILTL